MVFSYLSADKSKGFRIHFIGIGGISMSALAKFCLAEGIKVSGSDKKNSEIISELICLGAKIYLKHSAKNVCGASAVVYTSALKSDNPEIIRAKKLRIPILSRAEFLGEIIKNYKCSIGIAGSHGKTTTTAMLTEILVLAGLDPTAFIGGEHHDFGNFRKGKEQFAVLEACEYKKNFLLLKPTIPVVLNIDDDHMDCYQSSADMDNAFSEFLKGNISVVNADDDRAIKLADMLSVTYGINSSAVYTAKRIIKTDVGYSFTAYKCFRKLGRINLKVPGKHNVYNALASIAVADIIGVDFHNIKTALDTFLGVKRRNENIGNILDKNAVCDYAHHPSEIKAFLNSIDLSNSIIVFQPHTFSRTAKLMEDFLRELLIPSPTIIYKTYPAREKYNKKGCYKTLYKKLKGARKSEVYCASNVIALLRIIKKLKSYSNVYFIGAGDIYEIAKNIASKNK